MTSRAGGSSCGDLRTLRTGTYEAWNGWESEARRKLLGFGDDGTGNPFCVALNGEPTIYTWSPIEQQARSLAANLREFWLAWLAGEIKT